MKWRPIYRGSPIVRRAPGPVARFLVDENLGRDAVRLLKENKWNAKYVDEVNLIGKDDRAVFSYAWESKRVLLTHDRDFLNNNIFPHYRNAGVIVFVVGASGKDDERLLYAFSFMQILLKAGGAAYMRGNKIVFSDDEHVIVERRAITGRLITTRYWLPKKGPPWNGWNENARPQAIV
jgi:predicted nuclease of predicted toxin-antitoxin system